ncbi:MAG: cytidine deaminase [Oscillospiraceae bacterium]|nr:cytidine deaminase [Oscillospiraceae bacterium]
MERRDKINHYLDIAETVSRRGTCLKANYGAIIVKNDEIISTGYTGAPRGRRNCTDLGYCRLDRHAGEHGRHAGLCRAVHAEANAIVSCARRDVIGGTLYLAGLSASTGDYEAEPDCCTLCRMLIINAGVRTVFIRTSRNEYRVVDVDAEWVANDDTLD